METNEQKVKIINNPLPLVLVCPLTGRYTLNPVRINGSGQLYEREAVESHILRFGTNPADLGELVTLEDLITDDPLLINIHKTLEDCKERKRSVPKHYHLKNVKRYIQVLEWFRNPTHSRIEFEEDPLNNETIDTEDENDFLLGDEVRGQNDDGDDDDEEETTEEEEEEEEGEEYEDDEDDDENEDDEDENADSGPVLPRFARFPPFLRSSKKSLSYYLGRIGPLQRNVMHFAVIYLTPGHLRYFTEQLETLLWNQRKVIKSKGLPPSPCRKDRNCCRNIIDFLLQKDGLNRSPLEYSILYGRGSDNFEKFMVFTSFFVAEKKRRRNKHFYAKHISQASSSLLVTPSDATNHENVASPAASTSCCPSVRGFPLPFPHRKERLGPSLRMRVALPNSPPPDLLSFPPSREDQLEEEEEEEIRDESEEEEEEDETEEETEEEDNDEDDECNRKKRKVKKRRNIRTRIERGGFLHGKSRTSFLDPWSSCFMKVERSIRLDRASFLRFQSCAAMCAKIGNQDGMLLLFRLGVRACDKFETLFHLEVAAGFENVEILEFMLCYGQYISKNHPKIMNREELKNACDDAFTASAANGLIEPAKALIRYGIVDVNKKCKNFRRFCSFSLSAASFYGHVDFVIFLLSLNKTEEEEKEENGIHLDLDQVFLGSCALNAACSTTDPESEIVRLLLEHGCNPNPDMSKVCESPLMICSKRNHVSLLKMLISSGAKINTQSTNKKNTALHLSVLYRNYESIKILVKNYAAMDILNSEGKTVRKMIQKDTNLKRFVDKIIQKRAKREIRKLRRKNKL